MRRNGRGRARRPEKLRSLQSELASQLRTFAAETDESGCSRRRAGVEIDLDGEFEGLHERPPQHRRVQSAARNRDRVPRAAGHKRVRTIHTDLTSSRLDPVHYSNDADRAWIGANAGFRAPASAAAAPSFGANDDVTVQIEVEGPLGLVYEQHKSGGPVIKEIRPGGLAARTHTEICPGMVLSAVQEVPVSALGYAGALELIRDSERPLTLRLHYPAAAVATLPRTELGLVDLLRLAGSAHRVKDTRKEGKAWEAAAALLTPPSDRRSQHRVAQRSAADGWLPIHLACAEHAPPRLVKLLLSCWPGSAAESDDDGWLPLHVAISFGAPMELIELLLHHHKDAARARDTGGNLPLHLAVLNRQDKQTGLSEKVVQALLQTYPSAAKKCNNWGRSALHLAVMEYCDLFLILRLDKDIHTIPEGSKARMDFEDRAKSDIAYALGVSAVQVDIKAIRAGSVIIDCILHQYAVSHGSPEADAKKRLLNAITQAKEATPGPAGPETDPQSWPETFRARRRERLEAQLRRAEGKLRLAPEKQLEKEVQQLRNHLKKLAGLASQNSHAEAEKEVLSKTASNQPLIADCKCEIVEVKKKSNPGSPSSALVNLLLNQYPRAATEADVAGLIPSHYAHGSIAASLASAHTTVLGRPPPPHPREGLEAERREREAVLQKAQAAASAQEELEAKQREEQEAKDLERIAQEAEAAVVAAAEAQRLSREADELAAQERQSKSRARKWLADQGFSSEQIVAIEEAWTEVNQAVDVGTEPDELADPNTRPTRLLTGIAFTVEDLSGLDIAELRFEMFPKEAAAAVAAERQEIVDEITSILQGILVKVDERIDAALEERQEVVKDVTMIVEELLEKLDTYIDEMDANAEAAAEAAAEAGAAKDAAEKAAATEAVGAEAAAAEAAAEKAGAAEAVAAEAAAAEAAAEKAAAAEFAAAEAAAVEAAAEKAAVAEAAAAAEAEAAARRNAVKAKVAEADRLMEIQQYDHAVERYAEAMALPDAVTVCIDLKERLAEAEDAYDAQLKHLGLSGMDDLELTLRLDKDIHMIPEGSNERLDFENSAKSDIAYVLGISSEKVDIMAIRAGSVIIECILHQYSVSHGSPEDDVKEVLLAEDCIIADCLVEGVEVKKVVGAPPAMPPPSPRDPLATEPTGPTDEATEDIPIPGESDDVPEETESSIVGGDVQTIQHLEWDKAKWRFTEQVFSGGTRSVSVGKKLEESAPISEGVAALKSRPDEFLAVYYQSDMVSWPEDQQKYTLISRSGTEGFEPTDVAPDGWMTIIMAAYERLPPIDDYPADAIDSFTESMSYQGITLHHADNNPLAPGRGQGVCDVPALKLIGDIDPNDVHQGSVGDCWLLSAISALAEFDGAIKRLFVHTKNIEEMPRDGPNLYTITLYELSTWEPVDVVVDERLAAKADGTGLLGCKPSADGELWPCYLEKAVAVHCGGWDKIDGGQCTHAWALLTGCREQYTIQSGDDGQTYQCFGAFNPNENKWETLANSPHDSTAGLWPMSWPKVGGGGDMNLALSAEQLFDRMCAWDEQNYIIGCGTKAGSDTETTDGIVDGHAYTVLSCVKNVAGTDFNLAKVRNPWGQGEFESGQWDDDGPGWSEHPEVKDALKPDLGVDDGIFWVSREEFFQYFKTVYLSASDMTRYLED